MMKIIPRNVILARVLGMMAVAVAPLFVIYGWWVLAVSGSLAFTAAATAPRQRDYSRGWIGQRVLAFRRRMNPHSWRPGGR